MADHAAPSVEQVRRALAGLRRLRNDDPAARRAVGAIRLTEHTLEYFWLPTLTGQAADDG